MRQNQMNTGANFASAFKTKPPNMADNLKNASSWSSLAQASSPHNALGGNTSSVKNTMDSFQAFKKQAKEKADRVIIFYLLAAHLQAFVYQLFCI